MSFRAQEMYKKIVRKVGEEWMTPEMKRVLKRRLPNNKLVMGRALRGIFAGKHIQFGNQVSEDGGNKTRRNWKPNVQDKRLFSYAHNGFIRVKVTTHALRCIDKAGGIDEYLLKTPYSKLDNEMGVLLKAKIVDKYKELEASGVGILSVMNDRKQQTDGPVESKSGDEGEANETNQDGCSESAIEVDSSSKKPQ